MVPWWCGGVVPTQEEARAASNGSIHGRGGWRGGAYLFVQRRQKIQGLKTCRGTKEHDQAVLWVVRGCEWVCMWSVIVSQNNRHLACPSQISSPTSRHASIGFLPPLTLLHPLPTHRFYKDKDSRERLG